MNPTWKQNETKENNNKKPPQNRNKPFTMRKAFPCQLIPLVFIALFSNAKELTLDVVFAVQLRQICHYAIAHNH